MKDLKELQAFLLALIADTILKDRNIEVEARIGSGDPVYRAAIFKENERYSEELSATDSTLRHCKKRIQFEVEVFLDKNNTMQP